MHNNVVLLPKRLSRSPGICTESLCAYLDYSNPIAVSFFRFSLLFPTTFVIPWWPRDSTENGSFQAKGWEDFLVKATTNTYIFRLGWSVTMTTQHFLYTGLWHLSFQRARFHNRFSAWLERYRYWPVCTMQCPLLALNVELVLMPQTPWGARILSTIVPEIFSCTIFVTSTLACKTTNADR